eukprot:9958749-Alexandrium_andersonii.AAC.1
MEAAQLHEHASAVQNAICHAPSRARTAGHTPPGHSLADTLPGHPPKRQRGAGCGRAQRTPDAAS